MEIWVENGFGLAENLLHQNGPSTLGFCDVKKTDLCCLNRSDTSSFRVVTVFIAFTPTHQNTEMNKQGLELLPLFPLLLTRQGQRNEQLLFFFLFFLCCCFSRTLQACDVSVSSLVESRFLGYCDGSQVHGAAISSPSAISTRCCCSWTRF